MRLLLKDITEEKYSVLEKVDRNLNLTDVFFSEEIERMLNRESLK